MKNRREEYTSTTNGISCETTSITTNDRQRAKDTKARNEMKSEKSKTEIKRKKQQRRKTGEKKA